LVFLRDLSKGTAAQVERYKEFIAIIRKAIAKKMVLDKSD